jgi:hypothetical protein
VTTTTHPVPGRFGSAKPWSERAARPLRLTAGRDVDPTPAEVAALQAGLLRYDEPAAAVVRAVRADRTLAMREVHAALASGRTEGPGPLRDLLDLVAERPAWVDDDLLARGARACRTFGADAGVVLAYGSLLGGYRTSAAVEPLVRTGRLTGDEALRRIGETTTWWRAVTAPGGLEPGAEGHRLALHVRVMHAFVNDHLAQDPTWDTAWHGAPINQYDQASTLGVFSTSFLLHLRLLGVRVSRADAAAVMHLWSYVGWLMGVDEEWLPRTERQGRRLLYHFLAHDPAPNASSRALAHALVHMTDDAPVSDARKAWERERALSAGTWLLGPAAMRDLGLPRRLPWYGVARVASNLLWSQLVGRLPGGPDLVTARGERAFARQVRRWYAGDAPDVPAAA